MKIQEKIKTFVEKIDQKHLYYIFIGVVVFVFLLDYFLLLSPQINSLNKISPEIIKLQQQIDGAKTNIQREENFKTQVKELKDNLANLTTRIKSKAEVPLILERISRVANQFGVKIDQIAPSNQDQELILEDNGKKYYSLPIIIDARSGYHDFGKFINKIESEEMILNIYNLMISSGDDSRYHRIRLNLRAIVYEKS